MPEADQYNVSVAFSYDKDNPIISVQTEGIAFLTQRELVEILRVGIEAIDAKHEYQGDIHRLCQQVDTNLARLESELRKREKKQEFTNRRS